MLAAICGYSEDRAPTDRYSCMSLRQRILTKGLRDELRAKAKLQELVASGVVREAEADILAEGRGEHMGGGGEGAAKAWDENKAPLMQLVQEESDYASYLEQQAAAATEATGRKKKRKQQPPRVPKAPHVRLVNNAFDCYYPSPEIRGRPRLLVAIPSSCVPEMRIVLEHVDYDTWHLRAYEEKYPMRVCIGKFGARISQLSDNYDYLCSSFLES